MGETSASLIAGGIGIFGTLAGVAISQLLTMSWGRTQRIADAKRSECRELLKALSHCVIAYVRSDTDSYKFDQEQKRERANAAAASLEAIWACMVITKELDEHKIAERWLEIVEKFDDDPDRAQFTTDAYSITYDIAAIAAACENEKTKFEKLIDRAKSEKLIYRARFEKLIDRARGELEEMSGVVAQLKGWATHRRKESETEKTNLNRSHGSGTDAIGD